MKKVRGLGDLGDKVAVRPGYGRNYLLPFGIAKPATEQNLKEFEQRRAELERQAAEALAQAEGRKERLEGLSVRVPRKAGEQGRLFGSVGPADIAAALSEAGVEVDKSEVRLATGPFRAIGEYEVELHLHSDVDALVRVEVIAAD